MDFVEALDQGVLSWLQAHRTPGLTAVMEAVTFLGERPVLLAVIAGAAAWLVFRRRWRTALILILTGLIASGLVEVVKNTIQRNRPMLSSPDPAQETYSFPSGHALGSTAVYVTLALLLGRQLSRRRDRFLVIGGGLLLAFVIGVTRLYLGVHYLSDVVAGWCGGLGCALVAAWVHERWVLDSANGGRRPLGG